MPDNHFLKLQPGTIVNGCYEVVKCLGTGSMGMVYACKHNLLSGHLVAMKVLFSEFSQDEVAAARFRNEIVASYGVNHPHVVRAYEYFKDAELDLVAFTMEFVGGGDLADRITQTDPLDIDESLRMLIQMSSGLQSIHDAGLIHRDLKPENILITQTGDIKITDFGIAKSGAGPRLTEYGGVVGTIEYLSPEYLENGQVDFRSDIYSLGVLAYEMVTGSAPFEGKSVVETMTMRLRSDPELPELQRKDCPEELSKIIMKSLERDLTRRYQSADEMTRDLISLLEKRKGLSSIDPSLKPREPQPSSQGQALFTPENSHVEAERQLAKSNRAPSPLELSTSSNPSVLSEDTYAEPKASSALDRALGSSSKISKNSSSIDNVSRIEAYEEPEDLEQEVRAYKPLQEVLPKPESLLSVSRSYKKSVSSKRVSLRGNKHLQELVKEYPSKKDSFFKAIVKFIFLVIGVFVFAVLALGYISEFFQEDIRVKNNSSAFEEAYESKF